MLSAGQSHDLEAVGGTMSHESSTGTLTWSFVNTIVICRIGSGSNRLINSLLRCESDSVFMSPLRTSLEV